MQLQQCDGSDKITLHGLWPQWAEDCSGPEFDVDTISDLPMKSDWPSCPGHHSSNQEFWAHEWKTHGTCTGMSEHAYFSKTLSLYEANVDSCSSSDCRICFDSDFNVVDESSCERSLKQEVPAVHKTP